MPRLASAAACATGLLVATGAVGCGGSGSGQAIARVGASAITRSALDHEIVVLAAGRTAAGTGQSGAAARRQALEALILSRWVMEEAASRRLEPVAQAIHRRVQRREASSFPGGDAEVRAFLQAAGQTRVDLEHEAAMEIAVEALRSAALRAAPAVTEAQARRFYLAHRQRYAVPLRREIRIANRKTPQAAEGIRREVAAGRAFAALSRPEMVVLPWRPGETYARPTLDRAIARGRLHALLGPVKQRVDYFMFEVRRVLPATFESFAHVRPQIVQELADEARRRALAAFVEAWTSRWRARTDCRPGYVVQGCRQYPGRAPQAPSGLR